MLPPNRINNSGSRSKANDKKRWAIIIAVTISIVALIWLAYSVYRAFTAVRSLRDSQQRIELILDSGLIRANPIELNDLATTVREDVLTLRSAVGPAVHLAPLFGWVPKYGPVLASAGELLEIADLGSAAGVYALRAVTPALTAIQGDNANSIGQIPVVVSSLGSSSADFEMASEFLQRLADVRGEMTTTDTWPGELQRLLAQLDSTLPAAQDALAIARTHQQRQSRH